MNGQKKDDTVKNIRIFFSFQNFFVSLHQLILSRLWNRFELC